MVADVVPFTFPRTGRMIVNADNVGNLAVGFTYLNGHGAAVTRFMGETMFRLVALDANGHLDYLPEILGENVRTIEYLTADEVDSLLIRISSLPKRA